MTELVGQWLATFELDPILRDHIEIVMIALPALVRDDLVNDPGFKLCDYEPALRGMSNIPLGTPQAKRPGRAVVLKRTLRHRPESFVRYVVAHELAHAYLCNRGRWTGDDPEHAADSLAAEWGFPRPTDRQPPAPVRL